MARGKMAARAAKAREVLNQAQEIESYEKQISDRDERILELESELEKVKERARRTQERLQADVIDKSGERVRDLEQRLQEAGDRAVMLKKAGMLLANRHKTFTDRTINAWLRPEGIIGDIVMDAILLLSGEPGRLLAENNHSHDLRLNEVRRTQNVGKATNDRGEAFMNRLRAIYPDPVKQPGEIEPGMHISEVSWWKRQ